MTSNSGSCVPVLLMVSGGSDSEALLEMAVAGELGESYAAAQWHVLHVNHMLRGDDADADEAFVVRKCAGLGVGCTVERVDIAALAASSKSGMEAVAREKRYELAERLLDKLCADAGVALGRGRICTAHTLDDRIETFRQTSDEFVTVSLLGCRDDLFIGRISPAETDVLPDAGLL